METLEQTPVEEKIKPGKKDETSKKLFNWKIDAPLLAVLAVLLILAGVGYWKFYYSSNSKKAEQNTTPSINERATENEDSNEATPTPTNSAPDTTNNNTTTTTNPGTSTSSGRSSGSTTPSTPTTPNTPAPIVFAATAVSAKSDHTSVCSNQYTTVNFTGNITVNKAGTVHYNWSRSDNMVPVDQTLTFTTAGTKEVTDSWSLGSITKVPWYLRPFVGTAYAVVLSQTFWEQLNVTSPNAISSGHASFSFGPCYQ